MGVLMPISGRIYDRIGPRWPVFIGLTIATVGTYLLHSITIDTSREHIMWLLALQGAGLGLSVMPIFSAGIAVLPVAYANAASAFNNVVRNVAGALGLAVLTAVLVAQRAQQTAGRSELLPANTDVPDLGLPGTPDFPPGIPDLVGRYATYQELERQVFVGAVGDLFLIGALLCALSALGALLLRSSPAPQADGRADVGDTASAAGHLTSAHQTSAHRA